MLSLWWDGEQCYSSGSSNTTHDQERTLLFETKLSVAAFPAKTKQEDRKKDGGSIIIIIGKVNPYMPSSIQ